MDGTAHMVEQESALMSLASLKSDVLYSANCSWLQNQRCVCVLSPFNQVSVELSGGKKCLDQKESQCKSNPNA